jgi:hypothetical protein
VGISSHLYLYGYSTQNTSIPSAIAQGYRIGARTDDKLYVSISNSEYSAPIYMGGTNITSNKTYSIAGDPELNVFTTTTPHRFETGESVILISDTGDLPENIEAHTTYYIIKLNATKFKLSSSFSNSLLGQEITTYKGSQLKVISRVSDKNSGTVGSPIQWDSTNSNWYIYVNPTNTIYTTLATNGVAILGETTDLSYVKRVADERSIDEKIYKLRVVISKRGSRIQESRGWIYYSRIIFHFSKK